MKFKDLSVIEKYDYIEKEPVMNDGHWSMLAGAIVGQAMKDYRLALKTLRRNPESRAPKYTKDEVEAFFMSRWYRDLTRIDGEKLIRELQEEYL